MGLITYEHFSIVFCVLENFTNKKKNYETPNKKLKSLAKVLPSLEKNYLLFWDQNIIIIFYEIRSWSPSENLSALLYISTFYMSERYLYEPADPNNI